MQPSTTVTIGDTKTVGVIRTLEAPDVVLQALREHCQRQQEHAAAIGSMWSNDADLVFTFQAGRPTDPGAVRIHFNSAITGR